MHIASLAGAELRLRGHLAYDYVSFKCDRQILSFVRSMPDDSAFRPGTPCDRTVTNGSNGLRVGRPRVRSFGPIGLTQYDPTDAIT